jgi:SPP1 gp7 family putative phage head morphogenesis protein
VDLEQEERELTNEAIAIMLLILATTKINLEKELRIFYQKYGKDGVVTWQEARKWIGEKDHRRRLTALILYLSGEFASTLSKLTPKFRDFLTEVVEKEMGFFNVDIDIEDVLSTVWGLDETIWFERLEDDVELWSMYVANDIKRSIMRRDNIEKVLKQLDKRFTSMENVIAKLAMTESTAVGSIARREIFKELGIKKYRYYAREDERTCEVCGSLHGLVFPISSYEVGVTASPIHPWCRCWEVPIMD